MNWGNVVLNKDMGVAAGVLVAEWERRCELFGAQSHQVKSFAATELGFEHNLGLLHKAHFVGTRGAIRMGIPEREYYLERCLLEAEGAAFVERGMAMCASVVGDELVESVYSRMFGKEVAITVPPHLQVPELRLQPASVVGAQVDVEQVCDSVNDGLLPEGFCYLALFESDCAPLAKTTLGPNPKLVDLLQFGGQHGFLPDAELAHLSIREVGVGYHVDRHGGGVGFDKVLDAVREEPSAQEWHVRGQEYLGSFGVGADSRDILCGWLSSSLGRDVRLSEKSLDLVTNSAALLDHDSKKRLRSLEALGDSVLSMMIARDNYLRSEPVERYQNLRSDITSNKVLSDKFVRHVPPGAVRFLPNVNPAAGVTGAKALESIFGAVWLDLGDDSLSMLLMAMGFIDFPLQVADSVPMLGDRVGGRVFDESGCCYLAVIKSEFRDQVSESLGPWPDFRSLLNRPAFEFDKLVFGKLGYERVPGGWHIAEGLPGEVWDLFREVCVLESDLSSAEGSFRREVEQLNSSVMLQALRQQATVRDPLRLCGIKGSGVLQLDKVGGDEVDRNWKRAVGSSPILIACPPDMEFDEKVFLLRFRLLGSPKVFDCMSLDRDGRGNLSASVFPSVEEFDAMADFLRENCCSWSNDQVTGRITFVMLTK